MLPIDTERLTLRRLEGRDADALAAYRSDPSVAVYQSWSGMTLQEAEDFIAEQERVAIGELDRWFQLAVVERTTDTLVGDIGVCVRSPGTAAEIGFSIAPSFQHRGYGAEACRAALAFVLSLAGVEIVEAVVDARNTAAVALVKRLGMTLVRTEQAPFKGEMCAEHHFEYRAG